ncbi:MAG: metallophosphoesterase [Meiothermus sp.]|nr:metallophosphoesterase [Meiothermus sp.]
MIDLRITRRTFAKLAVALGLGRAAQPDPGRVRMLVLGDWGMDTPHRAAIAKAMREAHRRQPFEAILTLGDNFYPRGVPVRRFVEELPELRFYPTFGNHDITELDRQFALFGVNRPQYTVRRGALEVFVVYSEAFTYAQRDWLEAALAASSATWKVVSLHRPIYSSNLYGGFRGVRRLILPLLQTYRVDLVLAGHDHCYERLEVGGVTYVISGGGGATIRNFFWTKEGSRVREAVPNFLSLEAAETGMQVTAFNERNEILDQRVWQKG